MVLPADKYKPFSNNMPGGVLLLTPADITKVKNLILSDEYCVQKKYDGYRVILMIEGGVVRAFSRSGKMLSIPKNLTDSLSTCMRTVIVDGELVGSNLYLFDILLDGDVELSRLPYNDRLLVLESVFGDRYDHVVVAVTEKSKNDKIELILKLINEKAEGIVFRNLRLGYAGGRSKYDFKYKFYNTASFIVVGHDPEKRSVTVSTMNTLRPSVESNVGVPLNRSVPRIGAIVEVRYLYADRKSFKLVQPVYLGERTDLTAKDCAKTSDLVLKAEW